MSGLWRHYRTQRCGRVARCARSFSSVRRLPSRPRRTAGDERTRWTGDKRMNIESAGEMLARSVESYLDNRYRGVADLNVIRDSTICDDQHLATSLLRWREAANWPEPEVIGEAR